MSIKTITSREFNQDAAGAKRSAATGPVFVTDRGRPSLVLLSYEEWVLLTGKGASIAAALAGTPEAGEIEFDPKPDRSLPTPAVFD
jgi:prevent-host-death family protein